MPHRLLVVAMVLAALLASGCAVSSGASTARELRMDAVRVDPPNPRVGQLVTIHVAMSGSWKTPFWQEEIALDASVRGPAGTQWSIPGFYTADCEMGTSSDGNPAPIVVGTPEWQIRLVPEFEGGYRARLLARDSTGRVAEKVVTFTAVPGERRHFVRVSLSDPHYFEFGDGRPFFPNGENVAWYSGAGGIPDYDRWFPKLAENGGNLARVFLSEWALGYEWGEPGEYRLDRAWEVDHILGLAEEKGIYLILSGEWFRRLESENPYWSRNGGPCDSIDGFFGNEQAKRMWRNRLRYAVARWGYSPNIMAWELWNEIDSTRFYDPAVAHAWQREMAQYLREVDPHRHLVTSSLGSFSIEPGLWSMPEVDFSQLHGYYHPNWTPSQFGQDMAKLVSYAIPLLRKYEKPVLVGEYGLVDEEWYEGEMAKSDPEGVHVHNAIWSATMAGCAGPPLGFGWHVYEKDAAIWEQHRPIAAYAAGVQWNRERFVPFQAWSSSDGVRALGLQGETETLLWVQNQAHTWWNVSHQVPVPPAGAVSVHFLAPRGTYVIERWDTQTGQIVGSEEVRTRGQFVSIWVGELTTDAAFKVRPKL